MIVLKLSLLTALLCANLDKPATAPYREPDCGVRSLFLLLQLRDVPIHLQSLEQVIPTPGTRGDSMADLQAAARRLGLRLKGIRVSARDLPLDRPAIAYLQDDDDGHFIVLRPVGISGTMVQVLDPPHVPRVIDYKELLSHPAWTGKLLVPESTFEHFFPWIVGAGFGMIAAAASIVFRRVLGRRKS